MVYSGVGQLTLERIPHDKQVAVHALHISGYASRKIAKTVELCQETVLHILRQNPSETSEIEQYKKALIGRQYGIAMRASNYITDDKLDKMNALQLMTINAIGIDKARDMEGSNRPVFNIIQMAADFGKGMAELKQKQAALLQLQADTSV